MASRRLRRSPSGSAVEFDDEPLVPAEWQRLIEDQPAVGVVLPTGSPGAQTLIFEGAFPDGPIALPSVPTDLWGVDVSVNLILEPVGPIAAAGVDIDVGVIRGTMTPGPDRADVLVVDYALESTSTIGGPRPYVLSFVGEIRGVTTNPIGGDLVGVRVRGINNDDTNAVNVIAASLSVLTRRIE